MTIYTVGNGHTRPIPRCQRQVKILIVVIDYFIKWIEVKSLAIITTQHVQKLF